MASLELSNIFLYNWHRFTNHVLHVSGNLYVTGENGTGKSTILDALQLVLIGDLKQVHFNQAAQNERMRSSRNPATYVLGKNDEEWLRERDTIAYIVLEFVDSERNEYRCAGVCIEVTVADKSYERMHFVLSEALDTELYAPGGKALPKRELRKLLRERGANVYEHGEIKGYQADLLNRLGGLNELFFELLSQALTFKPIFNVHDFMSQMVLPAFPIRLETMQSAQRNVQEVEALAEQVSTYIEELGKVVDQQYLLRRLQRQREGYIILQDLLRVEETQQNITRLERLLKVRERELDENGTKLEEVEGNIRDAEQKRDDAFQRLSQLESKQLHDSLKQAIERDEQQLRDVEDRWNRLRNMLDSIETHLEVILAAPLLQDEEREQFEVLLATVKRLTPDVEISEESVVTVNTSHTVNVAVITRIRTSLSDLNARVQELKSWGNELEQEKVQLEQENKIRYPLTVEQLRTIMEQELGEMPRLVCELLDVPDPRWQEAVEAQLGMRRFAMLVSPQLFDSAVAVLDRVRASHRIYGIRLLDTGNIRVFALTRALPDASLARKVETTDTALRAYLDMVLGGIMTCEAREQLRLHRHAITPDLFTYNENSVYTMDPRAFKPLCIGSRAKQIRLEEIKSELQDIGDRLAQLVPQVELYQTAQRALDACYGLLLTTQTIFKENLNKHPLELRIQEQKMQLQALDLSKVNELEDELAHWRNEKSKGEREKSTLLERRGEIAQRKKGQEDEKQKELDNLSTYEQAVEQHASQHTDELMEEKERMTTYGKRAIGEIKEEVSREQDALQEQINKQMSTLTIMATTYNRSHNFRSRLDMIVQEMAYEHELQRLTETELPEKQKLLGDVRREMENQLRQDILHRLSEQFENIHMRFGRINAILSTRAFHEKKYRLHYAINEKEREFYDIIRASGSLGAGSLYDTLFFQEHREVCERFFDLLLKTPNSNAEREEQERLIDYRHYFEYDIMIDDLTKPNQQPTSLARTLRQHSGGETQTPFYVAIAASFASLYRIGEKTRRPTIRLAIFDEAFSKMDQRNIDSTLDVFRQFGLQIVTATPPERCLYLGPRMDTSLVLTLHKDTVLVEPLRRYLDAINTNSVA